MKVLHINSSARLEGSVSRMLSGYFVQALRRRKPDIEVLHLDAAKDPPPHVDALFTKAMYTPVELRTPEMVESLQISDRLCRLLLGSDALVFGVPMYNFSVPSAFKAFIDNVVRVGVTFLPTPEGSYIGMLTQQKVVFITTRGADYRPGEPMAAYDTLTPLLRNAFGFMGVEEPHFVDAQPLQFASPQAREDALAAARRELEELADEWLCVLPAHTTATDRLSLTE